MTTRYDLVDPDALKWLATTLGEGSARGYHDTDPPKWRTQDIPKHLEHISMHIANYSYEMYHGAELSEDHLAHIFCRAMFCLRLQEEITSSSSVDPVPAPPVSGPTNLP